MTKTLEEDFQQRFFPLSIARIMVTFSSWDLGVAIKRPHAYVAIVDWVKADIHNHPPHKRRVISEKNDL